MNTKIKEQRQRMKKPLLLRADKVRNKVIESGLKQAFLAKKIETDESILSRFMRSDDNYITENIVSKLEKYFK